MTASSVLVAIPTFRRLAMLERLLRAIGAQSDVATAIVRVVVLDNDAAESAKDIVARARVAFPFELTYVAVPEPGLASVRNRALALGGRSDYLAMVDDDEYPEPQWLYELLATQAATGATAVVGPVPPILPDDVPNWVRELRLREVPVAADRANLTEGWSGNCLLDMRAVGKFGVTFDRRLDFAGGEDQLFFRQLVARGGAIAFAARAVAWEETPPHRRTLRFVLERSFRRGNTLAICDRTLDGGARASGLRSVKGVGSIVRGVFEIVRSSIRRDGGGIVRGACDAVTGLGMLAGLVGFTHQAYRRTG